MTQSFVYPDTLATFLTRLDDAFARPGRVYLVGETALLFEGRRPWVEHVALTADVVPENRSAFDEAVHAVADALGIAVLDEHPGDLIPLPDGYADRHRALEGPTSHLHLHHFDPYSVAFRFIARGDEPDYHLVLDFLDAGWLTMDEMDARLATLLPRFSLETIQQDPAEFRRKYKGLRQMAHAVRPAPPTGPQRRKKRFGRE